MLVTALSSSSAPVHSESIAYACSISTVLAQRSARRGDGRDGVFPTSIFPCSTLQAASAHHASLGTAARFLERSDGFANSSQCRVPLVVHTRLSRRDRGGPRRAAEVHRGGEPRLAGFFTFSRGRWDAGRGLDEQVPSSLALERLRECSELQEPIHSPSTPAAVGL